MAKSKSKMKIIKPSLLFLLPAILVMLVYLPNAARSDSTIDSLLQKPLKADEAYAWYLFHTGYAVRTKSKLLIFDYTRGLWKGQVEPADPSIANGWIDPEEIKDLDVYVFVSHSHTDHYDPIILSWQNTVENIQYFFGWQLIDGPLYHNMVGPRATYIDENIEVYTINSYHSGVPEVAYLVKTDDLAIYHGGDYNSDYVNDIAYLGTFIDSLDIAMLNDWCGDPIMEVIVELGPDLVLPGHFGGLEEDPRRLPPCCEALGLDCYVGVPTYRGYRFHYQFGGIAKGMLGYYSNRYGRDDIFLKNINSGEECRVTTGDYGGKCPDIAPDGNSIVFVSERDGDSEIYTVNLISGEEICLTNLPSVERQPRWSPDGDKIAFQSDAEGNFEIYTMDNDGANWTRLTDDSAEDLWPKWSNDGGKIIFNSFREGNWEIYTINSDGTDLARLTDSDQWETCASWSSDGAKIIFHSGQPNEIQGDVFIMDSDGLNKTILTGYDGLEKNPEWSRIGDKISFQSNITGNFNIFIMNTDGSELMNLTDNLFQNFWPTWGPAEPGLVYICGDADGNLNINILDMVYIIEYKYKDGPVPVPVESANVNNDDNIDILDVVYLINFKYKNGPDPVCS